MFIAIDGVDGSGKTTLAKRIHHVLEPLSPVLTKEPTGESHWGKKLREAAANGRLPRDKEIEFFHKDRLHHIEHVIQPNLDNGLIVITDRYIDSTLAYQTDTPEDAEILYRKFLPDIIVPDITFILNCSVSEGLARIKREGRKFSKFENTEVLERARLIFESREGSNYEMLDASGSAESTMCQAARAMVQRFSREDADVQNQLSSYLTKPKSDHLSA